MLSNPCTWQQNTLPRHSKCHTISTRAFALSAQNSSSILSSSSSSSGSYTQVDDSPVSATFQPPLVDVSNLLAGQAPTQQQTAAVRRECLSTGFLALEGHGLRQAVLLQLFAAAERFFDLPLDDKMQLVVQVLLGCRVGNRRCQCVVSCSLLWPVWRCCVCQDETPCSCMDDM